MGKRGRPPKKKSLLETVSKDEECYTILSSDEEETLHLPSPSQRRGVENERNELIITTPSHCPTPSNDLNEKPTALIRNGSNKKKILLNGIHKKDDTSGDSDATEVYVYHFLLLRHIFIEFLLVY
jgi:hypothetical protein